jgi:hypothetical protein
MFSGCPARLDMMVKNSKGFGDKNNSGRFTFGHQAPPDKPIAGVVCYGNGHSASSPVSLRRR